MFSNEAQKELSTKPRSRNVEEYENKISSLNTQLEEHKHKELELYNERDKLNKLIEHFDKTNKVFIFCLHYLKSLDFFKNFYHLKELTRKVEELNKSAVLRDVPMQEKSNLEQFNIEYYKHELHKRDEHIK